MPETITTAAVAMHDLDAERAVLSCAMLDAPVLDMVGELAPEHFADARHAALWRRLRALWDEDRGAPLDLVRVLGGLRPESVEAMGGAGYLAELLGLFFPSSSAHLYAARIREWAAKRELARMADALARAARDPEATAQAIVGGAGDALLRIQGHAVRTMASTRETMPKVRERLRELMNGEAPPRMALGLGPVDAIVRGVSSTSLTVVGARPGVGKSSVALNVARHLTEAGTPVLIFSLEMSREELCQRLGCLLSGVPLDAVTNGTVSAQQLADFDAATLRAELFPLTVDDQASLSLVSLLARAHAHKMRNPCLGLVVCDYLGLVETDGREDRRIQLGRVSRGLKGLAMQLGVPVLALAQLNRDAAKREGGRPQLVDLRDSGDIEQDADVVVLLSPKQQPGDCEPLPEVREVWAEVAKNRGGRTGLANLWFNAPCMAFLDRPPQATAQARVVPVGTRPGRGGDGGAWQDR